MTGVIVITLCLFANCARPSAEKRPPLKIAISQWPGYALAFVAQEKGLFAKHGVEVELVYRKGYPEARMLYENGEADGLFCVFADVLFLNAEGMSTKTVYVCDYSDTGDVIIARPDILSLADLKGKKVGIEAVNNFSHIFVLTALEKKGGLEEADVQFKQVGATECLAALERGDIAAGHTWEPTKSEALKKGYQVVCSAGEFPLLIVDVLAFRAGTIDGRPDDIRRVVAAMAEARQYLRAHRDEAVAIMSRAEGMGTAEMEIGLAGVHLLDIGENVEVFRKDGSEKSLCFFGKVIKEFYQKRGQMSNAPDCDEAIDPRFVDAAARERGGDT